MKKTLLSLVGALALLSSCVKDTNPGIPAPSLLGKWQVYNYTIRYYRGGQPVSTQVVTRDSMTACELDDYWQYNADSSGLVYYGKPCSGDSVATAPFQWQLYGDVLIQKFANGRKEGMTISNVSADYYTSFDTLYPAPGQPDTGTLLQQFKRIP